MLLNVAHSAAVGKWNDPTAFAYVAQPSVGPGTFPTGNNSDKIFMVGDGDSVTRRNAFSVTADGNGHFRGSIITFGGADFAEYFESYDGERIPAGTPVTFAENSMKINKAEEGETPFGVISTSGAYIANAAEEWPGKYERNPDGSYVYENSERKISNGYDPSIKYTPRFARKEWHIVGLMGQVRILANSPTKSSWIKMKELGDYNLYLLI